LYDWYREIQRIANYSFQNAAIELVAGNLFRDRHRQILERSSALLLPPRVAEARDRLWNIEPAIRCETGNDGLAKRNRRRFASRADADHKDGRSTGVRRGCDGGSTSVRRRFDGGSTRVRIIVMK
jgi:hypothetical protein